MISMEAVKRGYNRGNYVVGAPTPPHYAASVETIGEGAYFQKDVAVVPEAAVADLKAGADQVITDTASVVAGTRDWWAGSMIGETAGIPATPSAVIVKVSTTEQVQAGDHHAQRAGGMAEVVEADPALGMVAACLHPHMDTALADTGPWLQMRGAMAGMARRLGHRDHAGTPCRAVDEYRAHPAFADAAGVFDAGDGQVVAQHPEQRGVGVRIDLVGGAVHSECDHLSSLSLFMWLWCGVNRSTCLAHGSLPAPYFMRTSS